MGLFNKKSKDKNKAKNTWQSQDSHWELIIGFIFFFGGLYFLFDFISQ